MGKIEKATFGAGCFWGVEASFNMLDGVNSTIVGYEGGKKNNPTYEDVCSDETGHVEVVELEFDTARVSYDEVLEVFWNIHDPTQVNRQGPDVGKQYRSVIFYHTLEQKTSAEASKKQKNAEGRFPKPIATSIEPASTFWKAEEYHQKYLEKKGLASCHVPGGQV